MCNIVTSADAKYYNLALGLAKNIKLFPNYQLFLYDLGLTAKQREELTSLDVRIEHTEFDQEAFQMNSKNNIRAIHKINCIEDFIRRYGESVIFLDSDVLLIEDVASRLLPQKNQVVLTRRCQRECKPHILINGKINTGVMAFGSEVGSDFFNSWRALCQDKEHTDQSALSSLIEPYINWDQLDTPQSGPYCEIVLLDGNIYNDVTCRSGKIFHFKNAGRHKNKRIGYAIFSTLQQLLPKMTTNLIRLNRKHGWYVWKA